MPEEPPRSAAAAESPEAETSDDSGEDGETFGASPRVVTDEPPLDHQLSRGNVFVTVLASNAQDAESTGPPKLQDKRCTPNIKALAISSLLFAIITVAQVFAALAANSHALMMDSISMGVDALTYLGNIVVECRKRKPGRHVASQLIITAISLSLLIFFTQEALRESWATVRECQLPPEKRDTDEEGVNGWITLGFALGGVGFDIVCMLEFYTSNKKERSIRHLNMFSAFLHVGADFLRSLSTTVMSLVILLHLADSTCADAYTSIIIGATIIVGASVGFWKWLKLLLFWACGWERSETVVE